MSANTFFLDYGLAVKGDYNKIEPPSSGGTFKQGGKAFGTSVVGAGTYKLPDDGLPMFVRATGAVTITDVAAVTIATLASGEVALCVPLTSTTWAATILTAGALEINTAADLPIADAGGYTSATEAETALQQALKNSQILRVDLTSLLDADGDPLAKFIDNASPNPGFNLADSEAFGVRWNNNGTQAQPVIGSVLLPAGIVDGSVITMNIIASKTGATVGDATTFTVTAFAQVVGLLHDAESNLGGVSSAMTGDATAKTVQHETVAITNPAGIDTGPSLSPTPLFFTITPTSGTLGTDDVIIEGIMFSITNMA